MNKIIILIFNIEFTFIKTYNRDSMSPLSVAFEIEIKVANSSKN